MSDQQAARLAKARLMRELARYQERSGELLAPWQLALHPAQMQSLDENYHLGLGDLEELIEDALQVELEWLRLLSSGVSPSLPGAPLIQAWFVLAEAGAQVRGRLWSRWFAQAAHFHLNWLYRGGPAATETPKPRRRERDLRLV